MFVSLRIPRVAIPAIALLALASCGKSSKSTQPVVLPSLTLGEAVRLFVPPSFTTPASLDTTASLLVTASLDGTKSGLAVFVKNQSLVDAGQVYLRTQKAGASDPDSILLTKLAGTLQGHTYVGYISAPYTAEGIKIPFDGVLSHVWNVKGSSAIPAFIDSVKSVTDVTVTAPTDGANVMRSSDLTVNWSDPGGESDVYVGAVVIASSDTTKHVAGNVVLSSAGTLTVPAARLALLPAGNATLAVSRFRLIYKITLPAPAVPIGYLVEAVKRHPIVLQ
jgi:hypothetical protein